MDQQLIEWRDIPGYDNAYELSSTGIVRRKALIVPFVKNVASTGTAVRLKGRYISVLNLVKKVFGQEQKLAITKSIVRNESNDKRCGKGFKSKRTILSKEQVLMIQELAQTEKVVNIWKTHFPNISYTVITKAANGTYLQ